jgi:predicted phage-related endonuclease
MMATPDRIVLADPKYGLECKNRGSYNQNAWGEPGSDDVPGEVAIQCHASMEVTGLKRWDAAVLLNGNRWQSYVLEYDEVVAESMITVASDFWFNFVQKDICPELDGSESSSDYVASKWKKHGDLLIPADEKIASVAEQLREVRALLKEYGEDEERFKNLIRDFIGAAAGVQLPTGKKITWKLDRGGAKGEKTDWEAVANMLKSDVPEAYFEEVLKAHTKETSPSRRFLCPRNWSD